MVTQKRDLCHSLQNMHNTLQKKRKRLQPGGALLSFTSLRLVNVPKFGCFEQSVFETFLNLLRLRSPPRPPPEPQLLDFDVAVEVGCGGLSEARAAERSGSQSVRRCVFWVDGCYRVQGSSHTF